MSDLIETNVLILGCGIAGSTAAWTLAEAGVDVVLVTRATDPHNTSTDWAQGGIIYKGEGDTPELLIQDLDNAGCNITNPIATRILATEGARLVDELLINEMDVQFTRTKDGELSIVLEGAHSVSRIIHSDDATGHAIQFALLNKIRTHPRITLLTQHTAIDLLTPQHHSTDKLAVYTDTEVVGAYLFDRQTEKIKRVLAKKTILATGGLGQIFLRTSNPNGARGDGIAMADRAGARVINAEYVQFHPTTFNKRGAPNFLISEAVRGEGAKLVHADGNPFMQNYDEEWKDLAPRDVVSRSIHQEMFDKDVANVYLDLRSYIEREEIEKHFPNIMSECAKYGIDMRTDLVPVAPAAHYFCGGVWCDGVGRSSLNNLYAIGEVSCTGLHGANRLASSSLLEGLVWGVRAANDIVANLDGLELYDSSLIRPWDYTGKYEPDPVLIQQDMHTIKQLMWNYVGLVRSKYRLSRACRELIHLETEVERFYRVTNLTDQLIGLRNAVRVAILVADAAWKNPESHGAHFRLD